MAPEDGSGAAFLGLGEFDGAVDLALGSVGAGKPVGNRRAALKADPGAVGAAPHDPANKRYVAPIQGDCGPLTRQGGRLDERAACNRDVAHAHPVGNAVRYQAGDYE